jgi:hypothetical protein
MQSNPLYHHHTKPHVPACHTPQTRLYTASHLNPHVTIIHAHHRMPTNLLRDDNHGSDTNIMSTGATQAQTNATYLQERHPPLCPTDGDAIVPKPKEKEKQYDMRNGGTARKVDKKSSEYLVKSGIAGGIAGCAVRTSHAASLHTQSLDSRKTIRQCH